MEVAQIVVKPVVSQAEKQKVIDKLKEIKKEVMEGSSFFSRAILYSEDPGSKSNGGYYKMTKKTQFVKEFKDVAFSLQEGEICRALRNGIRLSYHLFRESQRPGIRCASYSNVSKSNPGIFSGSQNQN